MSVKYLCGEGRSAQDWDTSLISSIVQVQTHLLFNLGPYSRVEQRLWRSVTLLCEPTIPLLIDSPHIPPWNNRSNLNLPAELCLLCELSVWCSMWCSFSFLCFRSLPGANGRAALPTYGYPWVGLAGYCSTLKSVGGIAVVPLEKQPRSSTL